MSLATLLWLVTAFTAAGNPSLVPFASQEGLTRLARSTARIDLAHLANEFESQENGAFCGVASAVIVLNSLRDRDARFAKPEDPQLLPNSWREVVPPGFDPLFHRYTQRDFFDAATDAVKGPEEILGKPRGPKASPDPGLQLRQLGRLLQARGLSVTLRIADDRLPVDRIRTELVDNLKREGDYVLVNYSRSALGQPGGGHISPVGAYDSATDSLLILDVNPNAHPWVWAPLETLVRAMETRDTSENRGYLLVKEGAPSGSP